MEFQESRRRWFRFRLCTLLILVTVSFVTLGWVVWEIDQRRRERAVVAWLEETDGQVYTRFSPDLVGPDERGWWVSTTDQWFGERVRHLAVETEQVRDLSPLAELKKLEYLQLYYTEENDLSPLAVLKNLRQLIIDDNPLVSDFSPLANLTNLEVPLWRAEERLSWFSISIWMV